MRRKVSTVMEESLFQRAKLEAARQGRPFAAILEDALDGYLSSATGKSQGRGSSVEATWGAMAAPPDLVREIMEDEDEYLES
jgi:hypothetical protein